MPTAVDPQLVWLFAQHAAAVALDPGGDPDTPLSELRPSATEAGLAAVLPIIEARIREQVASENTPVGRAAPVYAWGESVTWTDGRILAHLNRDGQDSADLELDRDDAELLATMLLDAAGRSEDSAGELRAEELDELTEQYLRFLRGQGPEPDLSSLPDGCRARVRGQFATIRTLRVLAERGPEPPPLEQDPVAIRLGLTGGAAE